MSDRQIQLDVSPTPVRSARLTSPVTVAAIQTSLECHEGARRLESLLRLAARMVSHDARCNGFTITEMLKVLKQELAVEMDARRYPRGSERTAVTSRFITLCIDEFYSNELAIGDSCMVKQEGVNTMRASAATQAAAGLGEGNVCDQSDALPH
jgi:hypothetical protein